MHVPIRKIGNSRGVVIPKPLLSQAGLGESVDMTLEGDAIVLRKPASALRRGWSEAAKKIAERGADKLVMEEFANEADTEFQW